MKKHQKSQNLLYSLIVEMQTLGENKDQFIRKVKLAPEPLVIMGYDYQLAEVKAFCRPPLCN